ncbi:MAG TPA: PDZ domain-containing protein, partial [Pyrinomonadaceae bacterium]
APAAPAAPGQTPAAPQSPAPPTVATAVVVRRNFLGVRTEDVTRENMARYNLSGEPRGVGVREVIKGSPAEKAGLREGDVILRYDGEQATSVLKLTRLIEESAPEHAARLTIARGGSEQELAATLTRRDPFVATEFGPVTVYGAAEPPRLGEELLRDPEQWQLKGDEMRKRLEELQSAHPGVFAFGPSRRIGVTTTPLGKQLADYFGVSHGVLVGSVEADSPAQKAGLKAGDVVTEVDGKRVEDADDLVRALGAKEEGEVTLTVVRDRNRRTVRVTPERRQPQGFNLTPGAFRVAPPAAGLRLPRAMVAPLALAAPRALVAPRVTVVRPGRVL